jgi:hypothetical protein
MNKFEWRNKRETKMKEEVLHIPEPEIEESSIPSEMAEMVTESAPESKPLHITFEDYDERLCGIPNLYEKQPLQVVKTIRAMGKCRVKDDFLKNDIVMKPIINANAYSRLYRRFGGDVTVYEHPLDGVGRIFYAVHFPDRLCHIVAITSTKHIET